MSVQYSPTNKIYAGEGNPMIAAKKYIIFAGYVKSINDGQEHLISCKQLVQLYKVPIKECILVPYGTHFMSMLESIKNPSDLIALRPREDGDYTLPEEI